MFYLAVSFDLAAVVAGVDLVDLVDWILVVDLVWFG